MLSELHKLNISSRNVLSRHEVVIIAFYMVFWSDKPAHVPHSLLDYVSANYRHDASQGTDHH
jgi:hypothetical protein